jgi:bifunctional DNA-binding transcriptional regulator/antitoxin component of YhaV-PrlF toxin-antitoxin module
VVSETHYKKYGKKYYEKHKEREKLRNKAYYEANKDRVIKRTSTRSLRYRYGLTPEDFLELLNQQNGHCAICNKPPKEGRNLDVDHNHETGEVRGLLCNNCNRALGHFQESKEILQKAVNYLEQGNVRSMVRTGCDPSEGGFRD